MRARSHLKRQAKFLIAGCLYYSGLLSLWKAVVMRNRAVVLMYHRVLTEQERRQSGSHPALIIDAGTFARQMAFLKRRFTVMPVEELGRRLERREPLPHSSIVITFDDGWRDNYNNALPVLRQHGLPALVFLPVNYIGADRVFWQEALTLLLKRAVDAARSDSALRARLAPLLKQAGVESLLDAGTGVAAVTKAVSDQKIKGRSYVRELVDSLSSELGVRVEELATADGFIDWSQAEEMRRHGIAFGGHGVDHLLLTEATPEEAEREIRGSKDGIEKRLGEPVSTFSFPNGYWSNELVERVRNAGYRMSFITRRGFVSCDDDPYTLRRLNVHEAETASMPMFMARVVGLW